MRRTCVRIWKDTLALYNPFTFHDILYYAYPVLYEYIRNVFITFINSDSSHPYKHVDMVSILRASCSGRLGFEFRTRDRVSSPRVFRGFPVKPGKLWYFVSK
jgi:hypothetical protein